MDATRKLAWLLLAGCSAAPAPDCPAAVAPGARMSECAPTVTIGEHTIEVAMPRELSHCCLPMRRTVVVAAGTDLEVISVHLSYHDAKAVLVDGPGYGFLTCRELGLVIPETTLVTVPMREIEWRGRCTSESGAEIAVQLRAGETTLIPWPLP